MLYVKGIIILIIFQICCKHVLVIYGFNFYSNNKNNFFLINLDYNNKTNYIKYYENINKKVKQFSFFACNISQVKKHNEYGLNGHNSLIDHGLDERRLDKPSMRENDKINYNNDMDLFINDGLQLKQWYLPDKVKEKWKAKHIENVKSNYEKVLLNNKYNELFNMYRNIKKNNVQNAKKIVKTNRINPAVYIKKRLVSATAKYLKMSFMKTRKILWKIRYMPLIKAFAFLYYYGSNKYTVNIYKCIKSCLYNAINKYGKNNIKPVFHTLQANMAGYTKKVNMRAKGKTDIIREPHTHIRVVLEV
ncbi:50S ribosomal protein L22, apicoplast, putative [Hepatocystis sp. ex Piliocolobus tephrosceles]|nr:50S ribosomal protein L22, apicoplast, putative [Hepatocystis sp. ex Piliocolobus tephrosceles]